MNTKKIITTSTTGTVLGILAFAAKVYYNKCKQRRNEDQAKKLDKEFWAGYRAGIGDTNRVWEKTMKARR